MVLAADSVVYASSVRRRLLRRWSVALAAVVLAAMCAGLAEGSFAHTDDGCPVEKHCLACRLATGTVAVLATAVPVPQRTAERTERIWTVDVQVRGASTAAITPSRAPPLA
jgi:hypothetical protein